MSVNSRFVCFDSYVYPYKEFTQFMQSQNREVDPGDEWKMELQEEEEAKFPRKFKSRVYLDPTKILSFHETLSLEEVNKPGYATFDVINVCMTDGLEHSVISTMDEFISKIDEFLSKNS